MDLSGDKDVMTATTREQAELYMQDGIDLVFLDIVLDGSGNGIDFAKFLRRKYPLAKIIFITAHIRYCEEIFEAAPDGFLVKPFTVQRVMRSLDILKTNTHTEDSVAIKSSKSNITRIMLRDISYIESFSRKLIFYNAAFEKTYEFRDCKLSSIESELPWYFLRCHQSYCVNLSFVSDLKRYSFAMKGSDTEVPVSQNRFKNTKEKYLKYLGDTI